MSNSVTPWTAPHQDSLSFTTFWSLFKFMPIELVLPPNHFILCTLFSSCLQSFPASGSFPMNRLFHQVAKVVELQLQHQSFQRIFRFDFLAVQRETVTDFIFFGCYWGTHNSTLQRGELALEHCHPQEFPSQIISMPLK